MPSVPGVEITEILDLLARACHPALTNRELFGVAFLYMDGLNWCESNI